MNYQNSASRAPLADEHLRSQFPPQTRVPPPQVTFDYSYDAISCHIGHGPRWAIPTPRPVFLRLLWRAEAHERKEKAVAGVFLPDLEQPRPPDLPPGMVKLRLVKSG
jgi:hypothetical protein